MKGLSFDPLAHRYMLDGVVVPSVTGILKASGLINFDHIPPAILGAALERGTIVHRALHFYNEHDLDEARFRADYPDYTGYLDAWQSFCAQRHFVPVLCEQRIASRRYEVAGTLDCLGELDGVAVLLDFATGRPQDVAKDLQTAAYAALAREWAADNSDLAAFFAIHTIVRRYAVALRRDGTFHLESYADPGDWRAFVTLLTAQQIVHARRGRLAEVA